MDECLIEDFAPIFFSDETTGCVMMIREGALGQCYVHPVDFMYMYNTDIGDISVMAAVIALSDYSEE